MPIYEFYCSDCNLLLNFFSAGIDTEAAPDCPHCGRRELERRPARFAIASGSSGETEEDEELPFDLDADRLEGAMEALAGEFESLEEEEDPRQMARLFRRLGEATGMHPGPRMEEMLARLEAGEDPDALEDEIGGDLEGDEDSLEEWFEFRKKMAGSWRSPKRPRVDDTLYFL